MCDNCKTYGDKLTELLRNEPMFTPQPKPPQGELDKIDYSLGITLVMMGLQMLVPIVGPRPLVNILGDEILHMATGAVMRGQMPVEVMLGLVPSPRLAPIMDAHKDDLPAAGAGVDLQNGAGHDKDDEPIAVV